MALSLPYVAVGVLGGAALVWGGVRAFKAKLGRLFLSMAQGKTPTTTKQLYKDDSVIVFLDKQPGATFHALVVPSKPIVDMNHLTSDDLGLLESMKQIGIKVAKENGVASPKMGFVTPPWNTVAQLHLHVMSLPLTENGLRRWVFEKRFTDIDTVLQKLK